MHFKVQCQQNTTASLETAKEEPAKTILSWTYVIPFFSLTFHINESQPYKLGRVPKQGMSFLLSWSSKFSFML